MTEEGILAMEAGKDLNVRVAEDVMGCRYVADEIFGDIQIDSEGAWIYLQPYSENTSVAMSLSDRLVECCNLKLDFDRLAGRWEANLGKGGISYCYPELRATSLPEAICKVALLIAHRQREQGINGCACNDTSWLDGLLRNHTELANCVVE